MLYCFSQRPWQTLNDNQCAEEYRSIIPLSGVVTVCGIPSPVESDVPCPADSFCQLAGGSRRRSLLQTTTVTQWFIYSVDIQVWRRAYLCVCCACVCVCECE